MEIHYIDPVYYAFDKGTGVALIRGEDRPPNGALIDLMQGSGVVRAGAVVPVCWEQLWDYRTKATDIPAVFRWPEFVEWIAAWPDDLIQFRSEWRCYFGMPGNDLADAAVVLWEE